MADEIKKITAKEFREIGGLQEVNRCFLHPRGLAIEIIVGDDGSESFGDVWDYRGDNEGMIFSDGQIDQDKCKTFQELYDSKKKARKLAIGTIIQKA